MTTLPADPSIAAAHTQALGHAHEIGLIRKYVFSMDHKVIGIQFMFSGLAFMIVAGLLALAVRWQIAWPFDAAQPVPLLSAGYFNSATQSAPMPGDVYNMLFTMHATFMIFFVIIPLLVGAFGNFCVPLMIGARDMAFPFLNLLSFWTGMAAGVIMIASLLAGGAQGGWTSYPPLSTADFSGHAQSLWIMSLVFVGTSTIMGAINYLTTILNMRTTGMTLFRMPLTVWSIFVTSVLILMATPVLAAALLMLIFDRHFGTNFFTISAEVRAGTALSALDSGQPLLFQHLFWFYSHPAVYIMILPAMGITSDIIATFSRKPLFGYRPMVFALSAIALLGFIVWGHHMFASGMNPILGTTFMASTIMIALPSAIKTFNWLATMWRGQIRFTPAMLCAVGFVSMFVIGGLSGIYMALGPVDLYIHDTYYIVGHLHYVLFGGSMFGIFAGIYYWYPKMFGRNMNQGLGKLHFWLTMIGFNLTFFLMHIIGIGGHPRRYATIMEYPSLEHLQPLNIAMTIGALMLGMAQIILVINFFCSLGRYGNRFIIYPIVLLILEVLFGLVSGIAGLGAVSVLGRGVLLVGVVVLLALIDFMVINIARRNWDQPVNGILAGITWVIAIPLFLMPMLGKGDFWEYLGLASETLVISEDDYISAAMVPYPMAVDASAPEPSNLLRYADPARADQTVMLPAVTAVLVDLKKLLAEVAPHNRALGPAGGDSADGARIDLVNSPIGPALATRTDANHITVDVAAIERLGSDPQRPDLVALRPMVEGSRILVPIQNEAVARQNLVSNHKVSRSFTSPSTGAFSIVVWTNVSMGRIAAAVTGLSVGLGLLMINRRRHLEFGMKVGSNPWRANSLEWCATSPPWHENFPTLPTVYRGPYEYSSPVVEEDYLPQWRKLPQGVKEPTGH